VLYYKLSECQVHHNHDCESESGILALGHHGFRRADPKTSHGIYYAASPRSRVTPGSESAAGRASRFPLRLGNVTLSGPQAFWLRFQAAVTGPRAANRSAAVTVTTIFLSEVPDTDSLVAVTRSRARRPGPVTGTGAAVTAQRPAIMSSARDRCQLSESDSASQLAGHGGGLTVTGRPLVAGAAIMMP
jgi:hypothetical protein